MHFAVDKGTTEIISLLLKNGASTNAQDIDGISILMTCVLSSSKEKKEIFEMLLNNNNSSTTANLLSLKDCDGLTVKDYILEQQQGESDDDDCRVLNDILKLCSKYI